ncbi:hypothetical protein [Candidimonas nitroreducens]|uniref:Ead/Ea22-like family protein n=1 Tax=Candidimonas nitroreducens TaxID=683354 RepID=A0A225MTL1_9BURK|nr:hypothetical protein [Candidimonas nitroreducens]OWT61989.1 hypothetical protein CEY11_09265 [Candidimonas nitroreducens]
MTIDTKRLRELLAKATPGPWHTKTECPGRCCWHVFRDLPLYGGEPDDAGNQDEPIVMNECSEDDAALMAEARNQLPAILDELDVGAAQIAQLRESLRKAEQLTQVCGDWNLDEVEIDGEMIDILDLRDEFRAALAQEQGESNGSS